MTSANTPDFTLNIDTLRQVAAFTGLQLTDQRLEELRPVIESARQFYAGLRAPDLQGIEPAVAAPVLDE